MKRIRFLFVMCLVVALVLAAGTAGAEETDDPVSDDPVSTVVGDNENESVDRTDEEELEPVTNIDEDEGREEKSADRAPDEDFVRAPEGSEIGIVSYEGADDTLLLDSECVIVNERSPWVYGGAAAAAALLLGGGAVFVRRRKAQHE